MMKDGTCPKCSATTIMPNLYITDRGHYNTPQPLLIEVVDQPASWLTFGATHNSNILAWICGTCGYIELYVDDPQKLHEKYQAAQTQQRQE